MVFVLQLFPQQPPISHAIFATDPELLEHSWHGSQGAHKLFYPAWHRCPFLLSQNLFLDFSSQTTCPLNLHTVPFERTPL